MFNAEISAGSLLLPESRRLARLRKTSPRPKHGTLRCTKTTCCKGPATAKRQATLIRRLETLDAQAWGLIADGDVETASQLMLAALFATAICWASFCAPCAAQPCEGWKHSSHHWPGSPSWQTAPSTIPLWSQWAASTRTKLYQVVMRILAETKFLASTHNPTHAAHAAPRGEAAAHSPGCARHPQRHGFPPMTTQFEERLNHILPRLTSPDVLSNQVLAEKSAFGSLTIPRAKWPCAPGSPMSSNRACASKSLPFASKRWICFNWSLICWKNASCSTRRARCKPTRAMPPCWLPCAPC